MPIFLNIKISTKENRETTQANKPDEFTKKKMTSEERIDKSVLHYLKKIYDKVEGLEKLIKKLGCYDENNRAPKKRSSAYNEFVKRTGIMKHLRT